ncbi:1,4-alpha-glucan branching enzyme [Chthoniobacter flavus Ellin428]|uniref:1,4-alpha-glucan branching enzyme GlgB n=1 Tax=Chthoniobacter flavus Ellin428 TaxID=497964 RepID=B4CWG9_9BACT|nr:1,4-alpha-glucan branching protein GlgB [Chthoniobacter flavus]EDY21761.1 1,4-alpha-glucan branching enzyme [Chthoniobacter flavus Ellin428]TCO95693.1 1,4-alpha-glucan branching enzyme [Chthoniobacter flavus]
MKITAQLPTLDEGTVAAIVGAYHGDPFSVLGEHQVGDQLVVRVFRPDARAVTVRNESTGATYPALQIHSDGFFEATLEGVSERIFYQLDFTGHEGQTWSEYDPYSFGVMLGPLDLHLFAEGTHWQLYEKLGAHLTEFGGVRGTSFHVWAPNAQRVSVVGEFNGWDGRRNLMRKLLGCGVWEIFLPGVAEGAHYKFEVKQSHGAIVLKSDPFAFYGQHSTSTASLVFDLKRYKWDDAEWMENRKSKVWHRSAMSIYEVHLGSWQRVVEDGNRYLSYRELTETLLPYVADMGYTHIELLPIAEHPFDGSWGYQVTGYYAPTSRFGNPDEFRFFVDRCHQLGIGVILDWVPGHFPKDQHGLAQFDGTHLYEHADPRLGEHMDWGTLIFNYGRNEVRNFLIANALFWLDEYHIDGLRVDAVASMLYLDYSRKAGEWVPNCFGGRENLEAIYFLKRFNEVCYERFPGIVTIAEESTAWPGVSRPTYLGGLGFGLKWNMGWMHDFLVYMAKEPVYRRYHQGDITFSLLYAFHEHFVLVLSHDEVVHGKGSMLEKMPGDRWQKFANLRMFYAWMYAHPGKKLLFMGGEFGQSREWNHDQSLDWHLTQHPEHDGLRRLVQHLNWVYSNEPALYDQDDSFDGFEWIDFHDSDNSVVAFLRKSRNGGSIAFIINATPVVREAYRVGVNGDGWWEELINTDAQTYGGSNVGNFGGQNAEPTPWQGKSHSLLLRLPPLAVVGLKRHLPSVEKAIEAVAEQQLETNP